MQEDASPSQMSQQDGEIEVNATVSAGSPGPPECFAFGVRMTKEGAATAHSSCSVYPDSASHMTVGHGTVCMSKWL